MLLRVIAALARGLRRDNPEPLYAAALAAERAGERDKAVRCCERALEIDPVHLGAHQLLAEMFLQGESYFDVLRRIHEHVRPQTYIEIGVETGESIRLIAPGTIALGVDPEPIIRHELPPGVRIYAETSDAFFKRDVRAELGGRLVELALIDGMHHFEFALRDFMNLERCCAPGATLLIHDCFPHDRRTASRERQTVGWTGDIWRLIVLLKKYRPELSIATIAAPPSGLGVVRNLDPASTVLGERYDALCREFLALDYGYLERDRAGKLSLLPNEWERIRALLDRPVRP